MTTRKGFVQCLITNFTRGQKDSKFSHWVFFFTWSTYGYTLSVLLKHFLNCVAWSSQGQSFRLGNSRRTGQVWTRWTRRVSHNYTYCRCSCKTSLQRNNKFFFTLNLEWHKLRPCLYSLYSLSTVQKTHCAFVYTTVHSNEGSREGMVEGMDSWPASTKCVFNSYSKRNECEEV